MCCLLTAECFFTIGKRCQGADSLLLVQLQLHARDKGQQPMVLQLGCIRHKNAADVKCKHCSDYGMLLILRIRRHCSARLHTTHTQCAVRVGSGNIASLESGHTLMAISSWSSSASGMCTNCLGRSSPAAKPMRSKAVNLVCSMSPCLDLKLL